METKGIERTPLATPKNSISEPGGAKSDAHDAPDLPRIIELYPKLAILVKRWPHLSQGLRDHIMAIATTEVDHDAY